IPAAREGSELDRESCSPIQSKIGIVAGGAIDRGESVSMKDAHDRSAETSNQPGPPPTTAVTAGEKHGLAAPPGNQAAHVHEPATATPPPAHTSAPKHPVRKWLLLAGGVVALCLAAYFLVPWAVTALNTVSTDDAFVNGHFTFVAPRVAGQVKF